MKSPRALALIALLILAFALPLALKYPVESEHQRNVFHFGVTYGSNTTWEAKRLIDRVKNYTNLFIVDSWDISTNETALNEICQYATKAGLSVIVYFDYVFFNSEPWGWLRSWMQTATQKWGDKFLGIYLYDEPGGNQIDKNQWRSGLSAKEAMENASDYSDAARRFVTNIPSTLSWQNVKSANLPVFTSDYALYWFDYLAGYDTVFVELGWNNSRAQQIALCRGAANVQGKEWGAIVVWTYDEPPYLSDAATTLEDLLTAYNAGANYVVLFNFPKYPEDNPHGILSEEHFAAMEQFWKFVQEHPRGESKQDDERVALVLPKDYGWGTRRTEQFVEDRIWGFWPEDQKTPIIGVNMNKLIEKYGFHLDIIYDDPQYRYDQIYDRVYFWNSTLP